MLELGRVTKICLRASALVGKVEIWVWLADLLRKAPMEFILDIFSLKNSCS